LFYGDTKAGTPTITAGSGTLATGSQAETITAATVAKLAFTSTAVSATATSSATLGPITVQLQDTFGNAVNAGATTTVNVTSTSTGKSFAATSGGVTITSVSIASGATSASLFYGDTKAGSPTITASSSGLSSATQIQTIAGGAPTQLALSNCSVNSVGTACTSVPFTLGSSPGNVKANIQALDQFGNAATIGASITMTATSSSTTNYLVTGSPLTIDGTATPTNQSTGLLTVTHQNTANSIATITVHVTSPVASGIPDITFGVQK
jgi:S-adenosylmethionine hydrolase